MPKITYMNPCRTIHVLFIFISLLFLFPGMSYSQEEKNPVPDGTEGQFFEVQELDSISGKPKKLPFNLFENDYTTLKVGLGFMYDYAAYLQDDEGKAQMDSADIELKSKFKVRDFRLMLSGKLLNTKRTVTWKAAIMFDGAAEAWLVRESGIIIGVPELAGHIFIGRTKEGYSTNKVMNGHALWGNERQMALDVIPIMADGIKWYGHLEKSRIFWNLGYFNDVISMGQTFSTYQWQYVARIGWLPIYNPDKMKVLQVVTNFRYGKPLDGNITLKSRPESNPAPFFINTGAFSADHSNHIGAEIYYSTGSLMVGSEINMHNFMSDEGEDHSFVGGDVMVSYIFTGSHRPYATVGSVYGFVPVEKSVFQGGWGEWEAVLRYSTFDLNDGTIHGGKLWRFTPMVNWYLTNKLRMEFTYGYGVLDRFNLQGVTQFFESRLQVTIN